MYTVNKFRCITCFIRYYSVKFSRGICCFCFSFNMQSSADEGKKQDVCYRCCWTCWEKGRPGERRLGKRCRTRPCVSLRTFPLWRCKVCLRPKDFPGKLRAADKKSKATFFFIVFFCWFFWENLRVPSRFSQAVLFSLTIFSLISLTKFLIFIDIFIQNKISILYTILSFLTMYRSAKKVNLLPLYALAVWRTAIRFLWDFFLFLSSSTAQTPDLISSNSPSHHTAPIE